MSSQEPPRAHQTQDDSDSEITLTRWQKIENIIWDGGHRTPQERNLVRRLDIFIMFVTPLAAPLFVSFFLDISRGLLSRHSIEFKRGESFTNSIAIMTGPGPQWATLCDCWTGLTSVSI